jgi:FMN phosphatase YigB (HAD superfamily)
MSDYHSEREAEFIEYTTHYILRTLLAELGYPAVQDSLIQKALKAMYAVSQGHWYPEDDALPILEALRQAGYRLGAISNASDDADVQALIDKAGVRPYFEVILTSAAIGIRKPNPHLPYGQAPVRSGEGGHDRRHLVQYPWG